MAEFYPNPSGGGGGGGGAPTTATYITQTADGTLSNEQALSGLATGLMQVTTGTGVVTSITTSAGLAAVLSDETGSGPNVFATSPTLTTPILGAATATTINKVTVTQPATAATLSITDGTTLTYNFSTYTPVYTLVGGAGNTVPTYVTTTGRYTQVGSFCYVEVLFDGNGGTAGAGTGQVTISLPMTSSAASPVGYIQMGTIVNGTAFQTPIGIVNPSATTVALGKIAAGVFATLLGTDQNSTTRTLRLHFFYEV